MGCNSSSGANAKEPLARATDEADADGEPPPQEAPSPADAAAGGGEGGASTAADDARVELLRGTIKQLRALGGQDAIADDLEKHLAEAGEAVGKPKKGKSGRQIMPRRKVAKAPSREAPSREAPREAAPVAVLPRPEGATGEFLRIVMVHDVYKLANYPPLAQLLRAVKATQAQQECKVISVLSGDFLSPCLETSLDGGRAMCEVLNVVPIDYVCFGNHEFDIGHEMLEQRTRSFKGVWLNGNVSSPKFHGPDGEELPQYDILKVGQRKVCLTGIMTDKEDIFRPGTSLTIEKPSAALSRVAAEAAEKEGEYDILVPLTHLTMAQDRTCVKKLLKSAPSLKGRVPVVCGGHEYDILMDSSAGSLIVKVGADAVNAGVIDVWWDSDGQVHKAVQLLPLVSFPPLPSCPCTKFVQEVQKGFDLIASARIFDLSEATSLSRTRFEPCRLTSQFLLMIKQALKGVEIVLLNGGAIQGESDYEPGPFTYGDLLRELAFPTEMAVIELPGSVIAESIRYTRSTPEEETPGYLQVDSACTFDPDDAKALTHIDNNPLEPERMYTVAINQVLLGGMNSIEPLLAYVKANMKVPELERCMPAKNLVMEHCMKSAWRRLVAGSTDLKAAFAALDKDNSGYLERAEILGRLKELEQERDPTNDVSVEVIDHLIRCLDADEDGLVSCDEFLKIAQS